MQAPGNALLSPWVPEYARPSTAQLPPEEEPEVGGWRLAKALFFSLTGTHGGGFSLPKGGSKGEKPNRAPALAPAPTVHPLNFRSRIPLPTGRIVRSRRDLRKVLWTFCPKPPNRAVSPYTTRVRSAPEYPKRWDVEFPSPQMKPGFAPYKPPTAGFRFQRSYGSRRQDQAHAIGARDTATGSRETGHYVPMTDRAFS